MPKKNKNLILQGYIDEFSELLASETLNVIEQNEDAKNLDGQLALNYLKYYVQYLIFHTLERYKEEGINDEEQAYQFTRDKYRVLKSQIQEAISSGFQGAFKLHADKEVEYYCTVNPVPAASEYVS